MPIISFSPNIGDSHLLRIICTVVKTYHCQHLLVALIRCYCNRMSSTVLIVRVINSVAKLVEVILTSFASFHLSHKSLLYFWKFRWSRKHRFIWHHQGVRCAKCSKWIVRDKAKGRRRCTRNRCRWRRRSGQIEQQSHGNHSGRTEGSESKKVIRDFTCQWWGGGLVVCS